jgi:hypothetical protein
MGALTGTGISFENKRNFAPLREKRATTARTSGGRTPKCPVRYRLYRSIQAIGNRSHSAKLFQCLVDCVRRLHAFTKRLETA